MPHLRNKLTALSVKSIMRPGKHADGGGLFLQVTANPSTGDLRKSWLVRFTPPGGKVREAGIGGVDVVTLAEARERAMALRKGAHIGADAIAERKEQRQAAIRQKASAMSFQQCADAYVAAHEPSWRNEKHRAQWTSTLKNYAYPAFGKVAVQDVNVAMVMKVLDPIWMTKTETASRLRGRIENILDWATVRGYRTGENPARWKGHLEKALPAPSKASKVQHHAALPIDELPAFMKDLRAHPGLSSLAFQFLILTATRSSETLFARWEEIDLAERAWTIPASRMKSDRIHRVPLSAPTLEILKTVHGLDDEWIFPGQRFGKPLSSAAFIATLRRMGRSDLTAHGFRSTFRDWSAERTDFQNEVAEAALAHVVSNKAEAAYRRGDLFEKRRALMEAWAGFAGGV